MWDTRLPYNLKKKFLPITNNIRKIYKSFKNKNPIYLFTNNSTRIFNMIRRFYMLFDKDV